MALTIWDHSITSDRTAHTARPVAHEEHRWEVSWLPGRSMDRNSAITAMVLADQAGNDDLNERHRLWPHIEGWATELGLTGHDAVNSISQPGAPGQQHGREREWPDPEAGQ